MLYLRATLTKEVKTVSIKNIGLIIPTYNAGKEFNDVLKLVNTQDDLLTKKLIIDSDSKDETVEIAMKNGFNVKKICSKEFGHGKTRTLAAKLLKECHYIIYMTQDVFLQPNALKELINFIEKNGSLGVVYGKQEVDIKKSNIFEQKARDFNYPNMSSIKNYEDRNKLGIKTVFSSDAFAIYNRSILEKVGFFPDVRFSEDMIVAAKMIKAGHSVGYCAEAKVYHSHNYSLKEEYERMKNIGQFHRENSWIQDEFGSNESEGMKAVVNEFTYLIKRGKFYLIPQSFARFLFKYIGYKKGLKN